jgi:hypothetical protein
MGWRATGRSGWRASCGAAALEALGALAVGRELADLLETTPEALEQPSVKAAIGGRQRVVLPEPVFPDADEPRATEVGEMS